MSQFSSVSTVLKGIDLSLHFGQKTIFDKVNFDLKEREIVGVVGKNGSGKSSFLKLVASLIDPDGGVLEYKTGTVINYMGQDLDFDEDLTVFESVAKSFICTKKRFCSDDLLYIADIVEFYEPWKHLNHEKHEFVISQILETTNALGLPELNKHISNLSGGEKRKVLLAKTLVGSPDAVILDEPTNHLDIGSMKKLENFLKLYTGAVLLVSHDRYFLDKLATRMIEIFDHRIYQHSGNYQSYLESKAVRQEIAGIQDDRRQAFLKRELSWVRAGVKARGTKDKGRLARFYDIQNQKPSVHEGSMDLLLPPIRKLGNKIIEFEHVDLKVGDKKIVSDLHFNFTGGMKLGLIGPNGGGKTTLIKAILGEVKVDNGKINIGLNTVFNYQDQEKQNLNLDSTPFDEIGFGQESTTFGEGTVSVRGYLRRFLFDNQKIMTQIRNLSGGERARILLAKLLKQGGNCLILDEPTNDLDLETIRVLEESLHYFEGVAIVVSHDRYFLNRVCNYILSLEGDGNYIFSTGNYDDFHVKNEENNLPYQINHPVLGKIKSKISQKEIRQREKELKQIERQIEGLEKQIKFVENELSNPDLYSKDTEKFAKKLTKFEDLKSQLEVLMEKWEEMAREG